MLISYFKQYMKVTRGITDKSVSHYITGINSINSLLQKYNFRLLPGLLGMSDWAHQSTDIYLSALQDRISRTR